MTEDEIYKYSNPKEVMRKAKEYLGDDVKLYRSSRKDKKYMVEHNGKFIHFGGYGIRGLYKA